MKKLSCGCGCGFTVKKEVLDFINGLEKFLGKEIVVSSGARCENYNTKVGGQKNSAHTLGLAIDVVVYNGRDRYKIVEYIYKNKILRWGWAKEFIHIDFVSNKIMKPDKSGVYDIEIAWNY